jgi:hypothetical protein
MRAFSITSVPTNQQVCSMPRSMIFNLHFDRDLSQQCIKLCIHKTGPNKNGRITHKRMSGDGHGHPKVSLQPIMPDHSRACGWATLETAFRSFQGCPASRASGLWPSSTPFDTPCRTPMVSHQIRFTVGDGTLNCQKTPFISIG